ncbi:hypothetical protein JMJ35_000461 [Cladonia borealis]|uniref:Phytanoyl-CoA dioxygenase n=1 Tax=Cladonia borealis TaxID=184061 RepID=A0AA39RAM0_9LECA|nr:hypothetical protein JMJ35_000461 [Cladonia borealis]
MAPTRVSPPPDSFSVPDHLTAEQLASYNTNGYLIIPNTLSPATISSLLSETHHMLSSFSLADHPMTKFSTGETSHVGDSYFLTSSSKIHFFFEEAAFSPHTGALTKAKHLAINKIGHYLHELSPPFKKATFTPLHASIARMLGFQDPRVLQSMIICKQPEIGGAVRPHQDSTFLYTNPPSAVGFWIALEDATEENGCLSFARGSHKRAPVKSRLVRKEGGGTGFEDVEGARFPAGMEVGKDEEAEEEEVEGGEEVYELGEVKSGSLVLIHGNLLHKSEKNTSGKSRFIYTFHCIEGANEYEYDEKNWLQPPEDKGFSRLFESLS